MKITEILIMKDGGICTAAVEMQAPKSKTISIQGKEQCCTVETHSICSKIWPAVDEVNCDPKITQWCPSFHDVFTLCRQSFD